MLAANSCSCITWSLARCVSRYLIPAPLVGSGYKNSTSASPAFFLHFTSVCLQTSMGVSDEPPLLDRIHSWAKAHASNRNATGDAPRSVLPVTNDIPSHVLNKQSPRSTAASAHNLQERNRPGSNNSTGNNVADNTSTTPPPPAPPPTHTQTDGTPSSSLGQNEPGSPSGIKSRLLRFGLHTKDALLYSPVNVLLIFVPIGIAANFAHLNAEIIFAMNAVAIIPLAGLLSHATESVASRLGDTIGALLNVTFGNAVELIIL